jgi:uncharacterized protein (TIGR02996 family)
MTEEDSLLAAIAAEPDDDTVRLAYADWLDEHGQSERAEFIRVQCEHASGRGNRERRTHLLKRSMQLIQQFGREWFIHDWPDAGEQAVTGYSFGRGFVEAVSLARRGLRDADVTRIVSDRPLFALVRSFGLSGNHIGDDGLRSIAESPRAARLKHLNILGNPFTIHGLEALAASPHLLALTELSIGYWALPGPWDYHVQGIPAHEDVAWAVAQIRELFQQYGKTLVLRT